MKPNLAILIILISLMGIRYVHGNENAVERGYKVLTELPVLTSDFNQSTFDQVWRSWPTHLRSSAERMSKRNGPKSRIKGTDSLRGPERQTNHFNMWFLKKVIGR